MSDLLDLFVARTYTADDGFMLAYRYFIPADYDPAKKYPFLLFLHGAGERGYDNEQQFLNGIRELYDLPDSPLTETVVLVPQCPSGCRWTDTPWENGNYSTAAIPESKPLSAVMHVIDELAAAYNLDEDRFYVTGLSMGGFGTWDVLARHGDRFAAGMPICGGGDPDCADALRQIPIRTFHGDGDGAVPVAGTRAMAAAITKNGTNQSARFTYTEFAGMGHAIWSRVYADPDNAAWLFAQKLSDRAAH